MPTGAWAPESVRGQQVPVDRVDQVLGEVLARPEFAPPSPAPLWRALGAAWDWTWARLGDLLEWLAPGLASASPGWSLLARVGVAVLALVGVAVLVQLARLGLRSLDAARRRRNAGPATSGAAARTAEDWEELARRAVGEGRWRDAVMALYQAVIHRLAREGRLTLEPGKTPGDYRREVRDDPRTGPPLERFLRRWEPVAFGRRSADPRSWHELSTLARTLETRG